MKQVLKDAWISELKNDFPEHAQTIEDLHDSIELILELAQDYYFCKHQIEMLKRTGKEQLSLQYQETLGELKTELDKLFNKTELIKTKN
jgi:nitrate/nitrite-specific signal transduction histidine kinase